jgi:hypothetical protein
MPPRSYSSTAAADDAVSTEGVTFTLDGVAFTCHGRISTFDLSEFAGPAADADADNPDPQLVRVLADMMRLIMGPATFRAFTAHRRAHATPDSLVQQILLDIIEDATGRPSARPSPSPAGPRPTPAQPAASPWRAGVPGQPDRRLPDAMLAAMARDGDIRFADAPAPDAEPAPHPATIRRLSLAHPERGVTIETRPAGDQQTG